MLPRSALRHERAQNAIHDTALAGVRRIWRRMSSGPSWQALWATVVGKQTTDLLLSAQRASIESSQTYMDEVLVELGLASSTATIPHIQTSSLVGVTGNGRDVASGAYGALMASVDAYYLPDGGTTSPEHALLSGQAWLEEFTTTLLADCDRAVQSVLSAATETVTGYVRMVEVGACSRCIILAGRFYRYNDGFLRHPRCRCRHIPADENVAGDMRTDPSAYFDSMSTAEQDRVFTKAGAEAIRLGADPAQVVNARSGMQKAQVGGRRVLTTTVAAKGRIRLMPETIIAEASSREDAIRLLTKYGFIR